MPVEPPLVARSTAYAVGDVVRVPTVDGVVGSHAFADRIDRCTRSGAQQTADFGVSQAVVHLRVVQLSAAVGRGFPAYASL